MSIQYRSEHDSVGERSVPKDVYYGVQSLRAAENFPITGLAVHPEQSLVFVHDFTLSLLCCPGPDDPIVLGQ